MNEDKLQSMALTISFLEGQLNNLLIKYDILADALEKVNPRHDAEKITESSIEEHLGDMSIEAMIQQAKSFEQNYDAGSVKNLHGKDKKEYEFARIQYGLIQEKLKSLGQTFETIVNSSTEVKKLVQKLKEHNALYNEALSDEKKKQHQKEHESIMAQLRKAQGSEE